MTDLQRAVQCLTGHSIALCRDGEILIHDARGISPMMDYMASGRDLRGFSVADRIVGRAAALLFVRAGIAAVYAATISRGGLNVLTAGGIPAEYGALTDCIRNRAGTGLCPMEQAVAGTADPEEAYRLIGERLTALRAGTGTKEA